MHWLASAFFGIVGAVVNFHIASLIFILVMVFSLASRAQPGSLDSSFYAGSTTDGSVFAAAVDSSGRIMIGGDFTVVDTGARGGVARLNPDGSLDRTFGEGLSGVFGTVRAIAMQSDGKVLIGGNFNAVNGTLRQSLARLYTDGSLDTNFAATVDGYIFAIALQEDDKIVIGGSFSSVNGTTRPRAARLHANGTLDFGFNNQYVFWNQPGVVNDLLIQTNGGVVLGGSFTNIGPHWRGGLARFDSNGQLDTNFNPSVSGGGALVNDLAQDQDGQILAGGHFTSVNNQARDGLVKLHPDGTVNTNFGPRGSIYSNAGSIIPLTNGQFLAAGYFDFGAPALKLMRVNENGSRDLTFSANVDGINELVGQPDGKIVIGGGFWTVNDLGFSRVARLHANGSLDTNFNAGRKGPGDPWVSALAVQPDNKLLMNGWAFQPHGFPTAGLMRLNEDGSRDPTFLLTNLPTPSSILLQPDGKIIVGGSMQMVVNGNARYHIARLLPNGHVDLTFNSDLTLAPIIREMAFQSSGKIVCVTDNGAILRMNTNGTTDTTFTPTNAPATGIDCLAVQPDDKIIIGGTFEYGTNRNHIARLNANGTLDKTFGETFYGIQGGYVWRTVLQPDGKVLIGGSFQKVNGVPRFSIARLNHDGSLDSTFGTTNQNPGGDVWAIALQADGKVLLGGYLPTRLARLDTNGILDTNFVSDTLNGGVLSIVLDRNGKPIVGGSFTTVGKQGARHLARLHGDHPPLTIARAGQGTVQLSWPMGWTGFGLEHTENTGGTWDWASGITNDGVRRFSTVPTTNPASIFRLRKQN